MQRRACFCAFVHALSIWLQGDVVMPVDERARVNEGPVSYTTIQWCGTHPFVDKLLLS